MGLNDDIKADLAAFLDPTEFGKVATYTQPGKLGVSVNVLFDMPYQEVSPLVGSVGLSKPTAQIKTADLPDVALRHTLFIDNVLYSIVSIEPDGTGMTTLGLSLY